MIRCNMFFHEIDTSKVSVPCSNCSCKNIQDTQLQLWNGVYVHVPIKFIKYWPPSESYQRTYSTSREKEDFHFWLMHSQFIIHT
jgi:hypothetical protein